MGTSGSNRLPCERSSRRRATAGAGASLSGERRREMERIVALSGSLLLSVMVLGVSGCASTARSTAAPLPPAKVLQPSDLAGLAGEWEGSLEGVGGQGPAAGRRAQLVRVTVAPDGSFTSNINGVPGMGKGRIQGGKVVFEGSVTRGEATLYEGGGRRILKGEGTWVGFDGRSAFELTKR
jgi:hypothetical protein